MLLTYIEIMSNNIRRRWNLTGFIFYIFAMFILLGLIYFGRQFKIEFGIVKNALVSICVVLFVIVIIRNVKYACKKSNKNI